MIGKVVTGCVAILPYHTVTQDRGSECRDFGFISRIVTALYYIANFFYYIAKFQVLVCTQQIPNCFNHCTSENSSFKTLQS